MFKLNVVFFVCVAVAFAQNDPLAPPKDPKMPEQVRLSLDEQLNIIVTWSTRTQTNNSIVQFGFAEDSLTNETRGSFFDFIEPTTKRYMQSIHRATLTGLKPQTKYYYRCGDGQTWGKIFHFKSFSEDSKWPVRFVAYGDLGLFNPQSLPRLIEETMQDHFDAVLHVGDFGYDMIDENSTRGDKFLRQMEPITSSLPYLTCPGNHEHSYNFSNYKARFSMPNQQDMFFSVNIGPVHVISINTEYYYFPQYGFDQIYRQYDWLKNDLAIANRPENRARQPWIITMGHRPMYCSNANFDDCTFYHRDIIRTGLPLLHWYGLEKLFYENGVDLELWAHEHSYERLWPIYDLQVRNGSVEQPYTNPNAPVHVVTGSAGCQEKHDPFDPENRPTFDAFRSTDYGYSRITVHNETHLTFEQLSDDQAGKIIDRFTLIRDKHCYDC